MDFVTKTKTKLAPGGNTKPNFMNLPFSLGMDGGWCSTKGKRPSGPASAFKKVKKPAVKSKPGGSAMPKKGM